MSERLARPREPIPMLRGEDETEISEMRHLIMELSWILLLPGQPACVVGRHPRPADKKSTFCAALYSIIRGSNEEVKCLEVGPEAGETRVEALTKLLAVVEAEAGKMMVRDMRRAAAAGGDGQSERNGNGRNREGDRN